MKELSPIERYAQERGIELTAQEREILHNDKVVVGMVARAQAAGLTGNKPIQKAHVPWQKADALGATGHHSAMDLEGKLVKMSRPMRETPNQLVSGKEMPAQTAKDIFGEPEPTVRRSREARLDDMTKVLVDFYSVYKAIPDSILREIQSVYWMDGQNLSIAELRQIAAHYLNMAEKKGQTDEPSYSSSGRAVAAKPRAAMVRASAQLARGEKRKA